ncbi:hypothetical protein ONS95_014958 [Cadophora gregata]|uniref:uncharacterized protein n=1 Tax=Cadophora gregata TaxID=51156 RepID=UPI0026DBDE0C|nr:uncharacterized protein ONS95_014958 [Cadophora gregata]KAK0103159.1 hypothetical protein ONS96_005767 [Cadophora gregata f. sp. sojae]KAK0113262.1 hypothetical protein ONS95_014958 [Cadophora gregata]
MQFYHGNFLAFAFLNAVLGYREHSRGTIRLEQKPKSPAEGFVRENSKAKLKKFKWNFIPIYLAVNGADWLQGPYIYPLYKDEKKLPEETVAKLFMAGFLAAAISASFMGKLADIYGRKLACLTFCVLYSLSCLSLLADHIAILVIGRILGGASTTLMYSVFESWMVTEFNKRFPDEAGSTLHGIFSTMTALNSVVAIAAGVVAESATDLVGTQKTPFMVSIAVLMSAFVAISHFWEENYGERRVELSPILDSEKLTAAKPPRKPLSILLQDKQLRALGVISCFFEGSMYIFIFFKFPALKLAHQLSGTQGELPFGLIFAILMSSMVLGSLVYNHITTRYPHLPPSRMLIALLFISSASFFLPVVCRDERVTFWCFCLFEICCGFYFPLMAYQKGKMIDDSVRANVYGLMRIPLNVFVVLVLSTTKDGFRHRDLVFTSCSALLLFSVVVNASLV